MAIKLEEAGEVTEESVIGKNLGLLTLEETDGVMQIKKLPDNTLFVVIQNLLNLAVNGLATTEAIETLIGETVETLNGNITEATTGLTTSDDVSTAILNALKNLTVTTNQITGLPDEIENQVGDVVASQLEENSLDIDAAQYNIITSDGKQYATLKVSDVTAQGSKVPFTAGGAYMRQQAELTIHEAQEARIAATVAALSAAIGGEPIVYGGAPKPTIPLLTFEDSVNTITYTGGPLTINDVEISINNSAFVNWVGLTGVVGNVYTVPNADIVEGYYQIRYKAGSNGAGSPASDKVISPIFTINATNISDEYQEVLTKATTDGIALPSVEDRAIQNTWMQALIDNNLLDKISTLFVVKRSPNVDFATIDWKRRTTRGILNGDYIYTTGVDIKGDGLTAYFDTNFNPVTANDGIYTAGNACRFILQTQDGTESNRLDGVLGDTTRNRLLNANSSSSNTINQNNGSNGSSVNMLGNSFKGIQRVDNAGITVRRDKTYYIYRSGSTSLLLYNETQKVLAGGTQRGNSGFSVYGMGAAFTQQEWDTLVDIFTTT